MAGAGFSAFFDSELPEEVKLLELSDREGNCGNDDSSMGSSENENGSGCNWSTSIRVLPSLACDKLWTPSFNLGFNCIRFMGRDESLSSCLSFAASSLLAATGIERETGPIMRDLLLAGKNMGKGGVGALFGK